MYLRTVHLFVLGLAAYVAATEVKTFAQLAYSQPLAALGSATDGIHVTFHETTGKQVVVELHSASPSFCANNPKFEIQVDSQAREIHIQALALPGEAPKNCSGPSRVIHRNLNVGELSIGKYRVFFWSGDQRRELAGFNHRASEIQSLVGLATAK